LGSKNRLRIGIELDRGLKDWEIELTVAQMDCVLMMLWKVEMVVCVE